MTLDDNYSLNLYIVLTTCCIAIILENEELVRREFLVDFQTKDYRISTKSYILSL